MIFKIWWDLKLGMDRIAGFWNEECLYVCMSISFFVIYSKNLQAIHTSKFVILCNNFLRMPLLKKNKYYIYRRANVF